MMSPQFEKRTTTVVNNGRYTFLSNTIYQLPFIKYHLSNTFYQISILKYHLANTIYQILFIKYHLSNTIYQILFIKKLTLIFLMNQTMSVSRRAYLPLKIGANF